jgi:hypothetical protein
MYAYFLIPAIFPKNDGTTFFFSNYCMSSILGFIFIMDLNFEISKSMFLNE